MCHFNLLYSYPSLPGSMIALNKSSLSFYFTVAVKTNSLAAPEEGWCVWSSPKAPYLEIYHDLNCLMVPWKPHFQTLSLFNSTQTLLSEKFLPPGYLLKIIKGNCLALQLLEAVIPGGDFQRESLKKERLIGDFGKL